MSRFASALQLDVRLQARSRLYAIGIAVAILVGVAGRFIFPPESSGLILPIFYLLGIGGTTFMFGASMLLLEKSQGTLEALRVSPLTVGEYLRSKAATLSTFALVESAIVFALVYRGGEINPVFLIAGLVVLGISYTYIGIGLASSFDSVTAFLFPSATVVSVILQLPFLGALDIGPSWFWAIIPSAAPLALMRAAFGADISWSYAIGVSILLVVVSVLYAHARFKRYVGLHGD